MQNKHENNLLLMKAENEMDEEYDNYYDNLNCRTPKMINSDDEEDKQ